MDEESKSLLSVWRFNVALNATKIEVPKYSGSAQLENEPIFNVSLFHKVRRLRICSYLTGSNVLFLNAVFPQLAAHAIMTPKTIPYYDELTQKKFAAPCNFHMESGESIATSLYKGISYEELAYVTSVGVRNLPQHPESTEVVHGYQEVLSLLKNEDTNAIQHIIQSFFDPAKCNVVLETPWIKRENKEDDNEEEARLFYVAVTRAKSSVMFTVPKTLYGTSVTPSPFIAQLLPPPPDKEIKKATKSHHDKAKPPVSKPVPKEIMIGMRISHKTFGEGTVIEKGNSEKANIVVVNFDKEGRKRLLASFCTPI